MKSSKIVLTLLLLFISATISKPAMCLHFKSMENHQEINIKGAWQGILQVQGIELRVIFKISENEDGFLKATMDSPDQGAVDIPTDEVIFKNDSLIIKAAALTGIYQGKVESDTTIVGKWTQGGNTLQLDLKRLVKAPEFNRPQEPQKPYPYEEEEVEYINERDSINLAGTLTYPSSKGSFPAVILITGSGAQDRNEALLGHKPFLVLADHLTRNGIAVLRVDDRGVGGSTGNISNSTSKDFAGDVLSGVEYLKSRPEIDTKHIGLIGHSEGGIIAPIVAAKSSDVAFIVLMAGTGLTGEEILYLQGALIAEANGSAEEAIAKNKEQQEQIFEVLKNVEDDSIAEKMLREIMEKATPDSLKKDTVQFKTQLDAQLKQVLSPWFRYFLTFDPKTALRKVKCPVLSIIGEKDLQVPPKENSKAIEGALIDSGNTDFTIKELPQLNHLFQTAKTGSPTEYSKIEETISPIALNIMTKWILERVRK